MVHIRYRLGQQVRESTWDAPRNVDLNAVEDHANAWLRNTYNLTVFSLEYIGRLSWEIRVDGNKVGHVHAWDDRFGKQSQDVMDAEDGKGLFLSP